jgi:hypothetical protein
VARRLGTRQREGRDVRFLLPAGEEAPDPLVGVATSRLIIFASFRIYLINQRLYAQHMRQRNPQNRRAYELTLTNAGREALSEAESAVEDAEEAVLAPLNEGGVCSCTSCS